MHIKRILIFGRPGSGKSTFAFQLSQQLHLPVYHLDRYFFKNNWQPINYHHFLTIQKKLAAKKKWIIDGNNPDSLEIRYQKCDVGLYFNYPKIICLWRVCKRLFFKNQRIQDRGSNCHEKLNYMLIRYIWNFDQRIQNILPKLQLKYPNVPFFEIKNDQQLKKVNQWIQQS